MNQKSKIKAAIIAMSVFQMGTNALAPILSYLKYSFPDISDIALQQLITLPNIFVIIGNFLTASLSKKLSKRAIAALGCFLFAFSGICSFIYYQHFSLLLLFSAFSGCGIGLMVPIATGLVTEYFLSAECASVMGYQTCSAQFGGACITVLVAIAALLHWHMAFLVYLIALPGFFLTLWGLPSKKANSDTYHSIFHNWLGKISFFPLFLSFCITMLFNVLPANISIFAQTFFPSSRQLAGISSALLLLSGAVSALLYGKISAFLKSYTPIVGFTMLAIGLTLCNIASIPWVFALGCMIGGCSISLVMPYNLLLAASKDISCSVQASALCMIFSNLGGFSASFFTLLSPNCISRRFSISAFFATFVVILLVSLQLIHNTKNHHTNA